MNIKNGIWTSISVKKNLGNYESIGFEAGASFSDLDPSNEENWEDAWAVVDSQIEKKLLELEETMNVKKSK